MVINKLDPSGSSKPKVILIWWPQILVCRVCRGGASQAPEVLYSIPSMLSISIHDYHQQRLTYSSSFCCKYLGALCLCCLGLSFTFVCRLNFRALCWLPLSLIFYKLYLKEYSLSVTVLDLCLPATWDYFLISWYLAFIEISNLIILHEIHASSR